MHKIFPFPLLSGVLVLQMTLEVTCLWEKA